MFSWEAILCIVNNFVFDDRFLSIQVQLKHFTDSFFIRLYYPCILYLAIFQNALFRHRASLIGLEGCQALHYKVYEIFLLLCYCLWPKLRLKHKFFWLAQFIVEKFGKEVFVTEPPIEFCYLNFLYILQNSISGIKWIALKDFIVWTLDISLDFSTRIMQIGQTSSMSQQL